MNAIDIDTFQSYVADEQVIILDTRPTELFTEQFIPGAISIGLEGRFTEWVASLINPAQSIALVIYPGDEEVAYTALERVGYKNVLGHLEGGFEAWIHQGLPIDMIINIEPDELAMDIPFDEQLMIVDVRMETEFKDNHIDIAQHLALEEMSDPGSLSVFEEHMNIYVCSQHGYRSVIALSLMKRQGVHNVRNIAGGMDAVKLEKRIKLQQEKSMLN